MTNLKEIIIAFAFVGVVVGAGFATRRNFQFLQVMGILVFMVCYYRLHHYNWRCFCTTYWLSSTLS